MSAHSFTTPDDARERIHTATAERRHSVLRALADRDKAASATDLEAATGHEGNALHYHLNTLIEAGFVENIVHPGDEHPQRYALTALGEEVTAAVEDAISNLS